MLKNIILVGRDRQSLGKGHPASLISARELTVGKYPHEDVRDAADMFSGWSAHFWLCSPICLTVDGSQRTLIAWLGNYSHHGLCNPMRKPLSDFPQLVYKFAEVVGGYYD